MNPRLFSKIASLSCAAICISLLCLGAISPSLAIDGVISHQPSTYKAYPYISPTPGEITIVASTPYPHGKRPKASDFTQLAECGFNVAMEQTSPEMFDYILKIIEGSGVKLMLSHPALLRPNDVKDFVDKFKDNPNVCGWDLSDEPHFDRLPNLAKCYQILHETDSTKLIFINLIGGKIPLFTGKSPTYVAYLDTVKRLIHPEIWSYDLYPICTKDDKKVIDFDGFYYDMEIFSALSASTGRPFWAYCMSQPYQSKAMTRPAPTEADLRWESFSPLAYGAQGIVYWTYARRASTDEKYLSAPINSEGEKTPIWYAAQKVNHEIKRYNSVFAGCKLIEVRHTGKKLYRGTRALKGSFGGITSITTGKEGVMCSRLKNNDKEYLVIVNHTPEKAQKVQIKFASTATLLLPDSTEKAITFQKRQTFSLAAGGYLIFRL